MIEGIAASDCHYLGAGLCLDQRSRRESRGNKLALTNELSIYEFISND